MPTLRTTEDSDLWRILDGGILVYGNAAHYEIFN